MKRPLFSLAALVTAVLGLPSVGIWIWGPPLEKYLEFPPTTQFIPHARFSWIAFFAYFTFIALIVCPLFIRALRAARGQRERQGAGRAFPWWGWTAVAWGVIFWVLAWTRFEWFSWFQLHTFAPLWISFIVAVNAYCYRKTGSSLLTGQTRFFLILFPCSAAFWWVFEFLNRFVQNWHYTGAEYGPIRYFALASVSFSTVLPAVLSVQQVVFSLRWLQRGFGSWKNFDLIQSKWLGIAGIIGGSTSLLFVGIFPDALFPMLWVAPLIIVISVQILIGQRHVFSGLARGDWRGPVSAGVAGVICGLFWEMWNYWSLAKWHYTVPLVDRFHLFEMPILGYAGYLPFGIECAAVGVLIKELLVHPGAA